jgi:hypothetical protein
MNQHEQMINPQHSNKIKRRSHFDKLWTENEVQHSNPDQSITLEAQRLWSSAQPEWTRWMKKHGMRTRPLRDYVAPAGWQVGRSDRAAAATGSGGTGSGECGTPVRRRRWWSSSAPPPPTGRDATRAGGGGRWWRCGRAGREGERHARAHAPTVIRDAAFPSVARWQGGRAGGGWWSRWEGAREEGWWRSAVCAPELQDLRHPRRHAAPASPDLGSIPHPCASAAGTLRASAPAAFAALLTLWTATDIWWRTCKFASNKRILEEKSKYIDTSQQESGREKEIVDLWINHLVRYE